MNLHKQLLLGLLVTLCYDFIFSLNNTDNPEVTINLGRIKGSIMHTRLGKTVYAFRGIYYAEPPTGNLRFKSPVPKKPWADVMDASQEGPSCPQEKGSFQTENCLALNIYTKQIGNSERKSPVIVFIHPGRFHLLSAQSFLAGPYYLLDEDVVLVSMNYRLGSLGFLNTGDEFAPGNFGLKDQVEALRFVQKHIASFGGDPNSVTLTGQSAGARCVILHMVSPMSKGLFHRAISMSGSPTVLMPAQEQQMDLAIRQAELIGCPTNSTKEMYKCMMEKPAEDYARTDDAISETWHLCPPVTWYPAIEKKIPGVERFLSDDPLKLIQRGPVNSVPIVMGLTKDELSSSATGIIVRVGDCTYIIIIAALNGNDTELQELNNRWYELAPLCFGYESKTERSKFVSDELLKFYFNNTRITLETSDQLRQLFGTAVGHFPYYRTAKLLAKFGPQPVYFYKFSYLSQKIKDDWKKIIGEVAHLDDLQFVFPMQNNVYQFLNIYPIYDENDTEIFMVKRLTKLWAHFAKTGEPLPKDPELFNNIIWESLIPRTKRYLDIDRELKLETHFMKDTMKFWGRLFPLVPA